MAVTFGSQDGRLSIYNHQRSNNMITPRLNDVALTLTVIVTLATSALPCAAQGVIYTSRGAFEAAVFGLAGDRRDVDFEGALPPGGIDHGGGVIMYFSPFALSRMTFVGVPVIYTTANGRVFVNFDSLSPLMVIMDVPSLAFAADFSALRTPAGTPFTATLSFDNGDVFTVSAAADPNRAFFGYVTTRPFSSLTFSDGGWGMEKLHAELLDNITAVIVPEPNMFDLFTLGALLLGGQVVWRHKRPCFRCQMVRSSSCTAVPRADQLFRCKRTWISYVPIRRIT